VAPLPVDFLAALSRVGDVSCLEPIAVAYARSRRPARERDDWWRAHLADAFQAIVARERITRRHGTMKKIRQRWPDILSSPALSTPSRTTPLPARRYRT
jgi:hypothetical protein